MRPPAAFTLPSPLSADGHPPVSLPKYLKHQVYEKPDVFAKVDDHAIQVARSDYPTFRDLMWNLVYKYKLDDLEKARVIFRWISSKDMQSIRFDTSQPGTPEEILMSFKLNRGTFARIFEIMCNYSGIHCVTISGYAKGVDYLPGDRFSGLTANHSWNVVYIRGSWQIVDSHWAARYLSSGKNIPGNVVYEYDDFYFLMEPQQAVYSHFPDDERWQLLPIPLTLAQFESLPLTRSQFFKCAMDFLEQHHGVVCTRDGHLRMTLGFWRPGAFTYKLQYMTSSAGHPHPETLPTNPADLSDHVPNMDIELKSFLLQETTQNRLNFYFRLPLSGIYYLTIYAQEISNISVGRESTFRAACEYKIICDSPAVKAQPYPTCHDANWGPAWPHVQHYALEPTRTDGVINVTAKTDWTKSAGDRTLPPATIDVCFGKRRPEVNLLAKLHKNGLADEFLDQYQRVTETVRETTFHITLPEPGEYGLEIYANEPDEGDTYTHMCQYLLCYEPPPGWRPTPRLTASGADAGPSPDAVQPWRQFEAQGDHRTSPSTLALPSKNSPVIGPLHDMYNYELHAPPMGHLPRPYAESQYAQGLITSKSGRNIPAPCSSGANGSAASYPSGHALAPQFNSLHSDSTNYSTPLTSSTDESSNRLPKLLQSVRLSQPHVESGSGVCINTSSDRFNQTQVFVSTQTLNPPYDRAVVPSQSVPYRQSGDSPHYFASDQRSIPSSEHNGNRSHGPGSPPASTVSSLSSGGLPYHQQQYDQVSSKYAFQADFMAPASYKPSESTANWGAGPLQREPPKEFTPRPLIAEMSIDKPRPQELPPLEEKPVVHFGSFEAFRRVDEHAVSISQQQQDSFNQLIWQLIYARDITQELEKVRVIFLWLCTKDLHKMNFDNVKPDSPEDILMGIRTGKSTYAQIFYTLCRYAGLHCKLLMGYAKGAEYAPGMHFTGRQGQHSWNAVLVDKVWRLVDCHWAARRLIGKRPNPENVRYGLDMFYFLANPGQLIYTHFPHDPDWQLLRHPISLKEFENLAPVKSAFFKYNLDLVTHRNAVIVCSDPEICVAIAFPPQAEQHLSFTFGLSFDNKEGSEEYRGVPLSRYGRQETVVREHKSLFYVRPPRPGAYKLLIYAKHQQNDQALNDDGFLEFSDEIGSANMYGAVCEYRLVANFGPNCSLPPYPPCQSSSYGPNELAKNYNIRAMVSDCALRAIRGCLEIRFALGSSPGLPPPRLMGKLRCTLVSEEALSRSLLQRYVNGDKEAVFTVFLPEPGEYGLEIYANNRSKDANSFFVVWQYIIISDKECPVRGLPTIPPVFLGPMPHFESMNLIAVSHPDPFVQAKTGELCVQMNYSRDHPLRIMAQLIHSSYDAADDCSQQVLQQMRDNQVYFVVRFPHVGYFKLQIYALPYSEPGDSLPGVFNYLIEATQVQRNRSGHVMCFPQQFAQWKEGCYLYSPLDGILSPPSSQSGSSAETIPFRLIVPTARAVAVVVGDDWTHLSKVADHWEGNITWKPLWGREKQLAVCANYDKVDGNYGTLLEYRLAG